MGAVCRWTLICSLLAAGLLPLWAGPATEKTAFDAASSAFQDGFWSRAEAEFDSFSKTYTNSPRLPEALLFQAEARLEQSNYTGALELLKAHQDRAGKLADLYQFWQGETLYRKGDLRGAVETFARLVHEFPTSTNRLNAVVREAATWSELAEWPQVVATLQDPAGPFLSAAAAGSEEDLLCRGFLLLARAQLAQTNCDAADAALASLAKFHLNPKLDWERQFLSCRVRVAAGHISDAFQASTNLFSLAKATGVHELEAETAAFQGGLLEQMGALDEAIAAYRRNLSGTFSAERQRQALLKVTDLYLRENRLAEAAHTLETFLTNFPTAGASELALVTLGELRLREYESASSTNLAAGATSNAPASPYLTQATTVLESFTNRSSALFGRAQYALGWCYWEAGRIAASQAAFQSASERLPFSPEQAIALFKSADAEYWQSNYTAAIEHYQAVLSKFESLPAVRTNLLEPALYHIVRAALDSGKEAVASDALGRLLMDHPNGFYTDRSVLLDGQVREHRDPAGARKMFEDFLAAAPNSPLAPELELAVATTYEQENQWDAAIHEYDTWLSSHTNHQAQARVEYARAWANSRAGRETVALNEFTNFIARFPTNPSAPLAQLWAGDYYYGAGDFFTAEQNYQSVYQNTNWLGYTNSAGQPLSYQAMMMAGRAAFARQGWKDAREFYFGRLASNTNCPAEIRAQAFFALGDTLVTQGSTNKLDDFKQALNAYDQVGLLCPSNRIAILALGAKANCLLQCQDYGNATNCFLQVIHSPLADITARSSAKVGLGVALEKLAQQPGEKNSAALLRLAREQYLDVLYHVLLRDGEKADPFWTMKAGLEAARVCEQLKEPEAEWKIYVRLHRDFPFLQIEDRLKALQAQMPLVQGN